MNNLPYRMIFRPPPGVHIQQNFDGSLIFTYAVGDIANLREKLDLLRTELLDHAIRIAEEAKEAERKRQQLPIDKLTALDNEISTLKAQRESERVPAELTNVGQTAAVQGNGAV
jgi:hypothetical protein